MKATEAIPILEESKRQNQVMIDNPGPFFGLDEVKQLEQAQAARRRIEALDCAIGALRAQAGKSETPQNEGGERYYYVTLYSFSGEKPVTGPFPTEDAAWDAMQAEAKEEHRIDMERIKMDSRYAEDRESGEITLTTHHWETHQCPEYENTTTFNIICIG